jgi:hypothetical protein
MAGVGDLLAMRLARGEKFYRFSEIKMQKIAACGSSYALPQAAIF